MSLPLWFNLLRATHAAYRNRKDIKKEFGEAYNQADEANAKPLVRVPLWKGCVWIFLPLLVVQPLSGLLPEHQDSWFAYNFEWFVILWLAGSTSALFYLNRSSRVALREWERRREKYVNGS